jgi:dihydroorotate dehydrogenase electron transfer subunit
LTCPGRPLDRPRPVRVMGNVRENGKVCRIEFRDDRAACASPGQFLMAYVPGVDEIPLAASNIEGDVVTVLVKAVGECTLALCAKREGDIVGIRGPYGNGFKLMGQRALLVGGGLGIAPLLLLARRLSESGRECVTVMGAPTRADLAMVAALSAYSKVEVVTDDGSMGARGMASDHAARRLREEEFGCVYACGPEAMLAQLVGICAQRRVHIQVSLERWMKCGIGLCGSCVLDPTGLLVCSDGPVFSGDQLQGVGDFGRYYRRPSGAKAKF